MTATAAVKYLNDLYIGFDESNSSSPLGVTITVAANETQFFGNIFCHEWTNPIGNTACYRGQADCRLSASLYNHKMIISKKTNATMLGIHPVWGFVINQSQVEKSWAKCSYIWDGATSNRFNRGCGRGAAGNKCEKGSAYDNICASGKTCKAADPEVQGEICVGGGGTVPVPPTHDGERLCFFPGPALDYHKQDDYKPGETKYLRTMAEQRVKHNDGKDKEGPNVEKWNEVVVDELLFLPEMWKDPALAIPAIVYAKSALPHSKETAIKMRDQFAEQAQVGKIPIIMVDDVDFQSKGPFSYVAEDADSEVTIV